MNYDIEKIFVNARTGDENAVRVLYGLGLESSDNKFIREILDHTLLNYDMAADLAEKLNELEGTHENFYQFVASTDDDPLQRDEDFFSFHLHLLIMNHYNDDDANIIYDESLSAEYMAMDWDKVQPQHLTDAEIINYIDGKLESRRKRME